MSKIGRLKKDIALLYDVAAVPEGFDYWFYKLLNYVLGIFEYNNLPATLPGREIELNLILTGHAVIFKSEKVGGLITTRTSLYGYDVYNRPIKAVYGNPIIRSKVLTFGENSEVIYNNRIQGSVLTNQIVDSGLNTYIKRYARLLADIESTIDIRIVNSRMTAYAVASNNAMAEQLKAFNAQVEGGKRAILTDNAYVEAFRNIDIAGKSDTERVNDLIIARDKILASFFREIGVKMTDLQKRAQLTDDEVNADEQLLLINPLDMLRERKEGLERVNNMFGTDITVRINPAYDRRIQKGGTANDNFERDN